MILSIRGRGKSSFGQALFKSVKSMHILHFFILLLDRHCVGEPSWVLDFADDLRVQQALYFRFDSGILFIGHLTRFLLFGLDIGSDVKTMFNYVSTDSPKVTC